jgi:acetyl esterase/lipase
MIFKKNKVFLLTLIAHLLMYCVPFESMAAESPEAVYEREYPKYVDSKEPLKIIKLNDIKEMRKASQEINLQSIPSPITMPYGTLPIQQLDIYRVPGEGGNPVIFFIHAGAGDKSDVRNAIPAWLSLGYAVVSINHRAVPDNTFPEMVDDVNTALKWAMENIQNYGGDPDRIAVTGISCGGHLAALLMTDTASQKKYGINIRKVKCWFPMSGFYDMDLKENRISPTIAKYIEWICTPSQKAASPAELATGKEPPCLIIHGGDDWCVPKTNAVSLYNRLSKEKTTLAILKGYMHANVFYGYAFPDHEPARLIKNFLANHLPTRQNPKPENEDRK